MRDDREFAAWLAARWPDLLRSLVFLGHPPDEAERIAVDSLARLLPGWERLRREGDVDVELYREVREVRSRFRTHPDATPSEPAEVAPGLTEQAERRLEVEAALAVMSDQDREAVVLRHVAELSEDQVQDVTGRTGPPAADLPSEDVRFAAEAIAVPVVQPGDVRERVRERRRRALRRGGAAVAALVLGVVAVTWFTGRPEQSEAVTPEDNPLPIPWYAASTLHLAEVTVEIDDVQQVVSVPDGVVVSTGDGDVVMVDQGGQREHIGSSVPGSELVVEADNGWVAWSDPGAGQPELVVHDTGSGEEVGRRSLAVPGAGGGQPVGDSRAIAIDGVRVFYTADETDFAWEPLLGSSAFAVAGTLLDTADGARVSRHSDGIVVQSAPFRVGKVIRAVEGRLTRDGRYLFARAEFQEIEVHDVATGEPLPRMYAASQQAESWGYVDDGTFLFALQNKLSTYQDVLGLSGRGPFRVYHCDPARPEPCRALLELPEDVAEAPVFAR